MTGPSLAHLLVGPLLALAVVVALGLVLFALADAAGRRREHARIDRAMQERMRSRERGEASWERKA